MPYLNLKGGGNNSMVIKRGISEDVYDIAPQRLNDMVKAKLPEFQSPVVDLTLVGITYKTQRL